MHTRAFSVVEIAIVLLISGLLAGMALTFGPKWISFEEQQSSALILSTVEHALDRYRKLNMRLPCPAQLDLELDDPGYGEAATVLGKCVTGSPEADEIAGSDVVYGAVPVEELGIAKVLMFDNWGHKILYFVDRRMTRSGAFLHYPAHHPDVGDIQIKDQNGALRTDTAIYVLISHGENGHGGYRRGGARSSAGITDATELENCDCDSTAADTGVDREFVQAMRTGERDDLIRYKMRRQMFGKAEPGTAAVDICKGPVETYYNDHHYVGMSMPASWEAAKAKCEACGGHLMTFNDSAEDDFVYAQVAPTLADPFWIGLNDNVTEGTFDWLYDTSSYDIWYPGQPDNGGVADDDPDEEDCVYYDYVTDGWYDDTCSELRKYVCEFVY